MAIDIFSSSTYGAVLSEVNKKIKDILIDNPRVLLVEELPKTDIIDGVIYLIPSQNPESENIYDEWVHINNKWEVIGNKKIDLSDYVTHEYLSELIEAVEDDLKELREGKVDKDLGNIDEDGVEKIKEIVSEERYLKPDIDGFVNNLKALGDVEVQNGALKTSDNNDNSVEVGGNSVTIKDAERKKTTITKNYVKVENDTSYSEIHPTYIVEAGKRLDEQYVKIEEGKDLSTNDYTDQDKLKVDNALQATGGTLEGPIVLDDYSAGLMSQPIGGIEVRPARFLVRTGYSNQDFAIFLANAKEGEPGTKPQHYNINDAIALFRIGYMGNIELRSKDNVNISSDNIFKAISADETYLISNKDVRIIGGENVIFAQDSPNTAGDIHYYRNGIGYSAGGHLYIKCLDDDIDIRGYNVKIYSDYEIKLLPGAKEGNTPGIDPIKTGNIKGSTLIDGTKPTITNFSDIHSANFEENGTSLKYKYNSLINNTQIFYFNINASTTDSELISMLTTARSNFNKYVNDLTKQSIYSTPFLIEGSTYGINSVYQQLIIEDETSIDIKTPFISNDHKLYWFDLGLTDQDWGNQLTIYNVSGDMLIEIAYNPFTYTYETHRYAGGEIGKLPSLIFNMKVPRN